MHVYRVRVRIVPFDAAAYNISVVVRASNSHAARAAAEDIMRDRMSRANVRAIVGIDQRRISR